MADDQIPTEALEAATLAVHHVDCPEGESCMETMTSWGRYSRYAQAAVAAAAPVLIAEGRRQAAEAIRAIDVAQIEHLYGDSTRVGLTIAARIAEGRS